MIFAIHGTEKENWQNERLCSQWNGIIIELNFAETHEIKRNLFTIENR